MMGKKSPFFDKKTNRVYNIKTAPKLNQREKMTAENLIDTLQKIKVQIESIQCEIEKIQRQKQDEIDRVNFEKYHNQNILKSANLMREAFSLFKTGLTAWEVAERMQDKFKNVWDAYYFISQEKHQENVRYQFARAYLVHTLTQKTDLSYREIGKISGYSAGRVSQIAHTFKN